MEKGYNGFKNYETWLVAIWMTNDETIYELMNELKFESDSISDFADKIKDYTEEPIFEITGISGMVADLMNAALSHVDYYELAEHFMEC